MLPLTPAPLQTAGERALFAELTRWDTGGAVRGAVVASIPVVDDQLGRRLSDAVLLVPEGVAVVRVVEVTRQSGVVTAVPEGPWSIGDGARPGAVLQLAGGGSTPLDGLMRAGMDAAVRLRGAGLEPGRIARLTVLVGEVTGLQPADGDLGEGDQVAVLDPRSLLLGFARASRYAGTDNPRLWTTADVRAALDALGLEGRGPTVEELNGEGFPYSPYVLRRRELMAPAAMAATHAGLAPVPAGVDAPARAAQTTAAQTAAEEAPAAPAPLVDPVAAAAVAAAAVRADEAAARAAAAHAATVQAPAAQAPGVQAPAAWAGAPAPRVQRDTIQVGADPLRAGAWSAVATAPPTAVGPHGPVPHGPVPHGPVPHGLVPAGAAPYAAGSAEDTGGLGGLFGAHPSAPVGPVPQAPATSFLDPHDGSHDSHDGSQHGSQGGEDRTDPAAPRHGRRGVLLTVVAVLLVVALGLGGYLLLGRGARPAGAVTAGAAAPTSPAGAPAGPQVGQTQEVRGDTFTLETTKVDSTCVGHSYGKVADLFQQGDCSGLTRGLFSTSDGGHEAVVAVSHVEMADTAAARALLKLADTSDTGNVSDLLREGARYSGGPQKLAADREYASTLSGRTVTIVETSWVDSGDAGSGSALQQLAKSGLSLELPPVPAG